MSENYEGSKMEVVDDLMDEFLNKLFFSLRTDKEPDLASKRQTILLRLRSARNLSDFGQMDRNTLDAIILLGENTDWKHRASFEKFIAFIQGKTRFSDVTPRMDADGKVLVKGKGKPVRIDAKKYWEIVGRIKEEQQKKTVNLVNTIVAEKKFMPDMIVLVLDSLREVDANRRTIRE